jgi:hypothetical protein
MTLGNTTMSPRWLLVAAGSLAVNVLACDKDPVTTVDASADVQGMDMNTPPPDTMPPPPDTADVPQPPPDMVVPPDALVMPSMNTRAIVSCGTVCSRPLDAIPNSNGTVVFFTAYAADGTPGVFRAAVPAMGAAPATPTPVVVGMGLEFPVGIVLSNDDATLYVADQTADRGSLPGMGAVFSMPAAGGAPTVVNIGTTLIHPSSITVSFDGNDLFVAGQLEETTDTNITRRRALFRVARSGGSPTLVTDNVVDPSGLSQSPTGVVLCHDTRRGGARSATAVTVGPTGVNNFAGGLLANYPAGLGFSVDGRFALFSGADPNVGPGMLTLASGDGTASATAALSNGMVAPLGLHRARMLDSWTIADESANETGQIFLVSTTR